MTDIGGWSLKSLDDDTIPLKAMTLQANVKDLLMTWKVCQTFRNTTAKAIEAIYTFPTAWSAVLTEFAAVIGDERRIAQAMPRIDAEEKYESAHEDGDLPILLTAAEDGIASVTLGNLGPAEEVTLELSFLSLLTPVNSMIRITLPFSAGERYSSDGRQGNLDPCEEIETNLTAEYPVKANFHITGTLANCRVSVPSHPSSYTKNDDGVQIAVHRAFADRNLVLLFEDVPAVNTAYLAQDPFNAGGWAAACVFTPLAGSERKPLRVDILADCSGSMNGVGVVKMREALAALTDVLTSEDEITLTRFGSSVDPVIRTPRAFTSLLVRRSFQPAVARIEADLGGTELGEALHQVLKKRQSAKDTRQRMVLLITDGEVWHIEPILAEVEESAVPVFVIGVGECAAEGHLQKIAAVSGGLCEVVTHAEEMTPAIERLVSSARSEGLKLSPDASFMRQCLREPSCPKNGYAGTAVSLFMRFKQRPEGLPRLHTYSRQGVSSLNVSDWKVIRDEGALAKAAAYSECAVLREAEELATQYGLLTADTSLLLVKEREASQKQYSEDFIRVPQMAEMPTPYSQWEAQPCVSVPAFMRGCCSSDVYCAPSPSTKPSAKVLWNPFQRFSKNSSAPMLGLEAIDAAEELTAINPVDDAYTRKLRQRSNDYDKVYGFTPFVESWSKMTQKNGAACITPEFWQFAVSELSLNELEVLKAIVQEQYPQLSDEQSRLLVPVVMVLLVDASCRRQVLYEPLVIAAQDFLFSLLGPDNGEWKHLKKPFGEKFTKTRKNTELDFHIPCLK